MDTALEAVEAGTLLALIALIAIGGGLLLLIFAVLWCVIAAAALALTTAHWVVTFPLRRRD